MNHLILPLVIAANLTLASVGVSQTLSRSAYGIIREDSMTITTNTTTSSSLENILSWEKSLPRSGSQTRASSTMNGNALRFSVKARVHALAFPEADGIGGVTADASGDGLYQDSLFISSGDLPVDGNLSGIARVRLIVNSERSVSADHPDLAGLSSSVIVLANFRNHSSFWTLSFTNASISGEYLIDVPAFINRTTNSAQINHLDLYVSVGANARALPPSGSSFAEGGLTVTWGGIVAFTLDDGTPVPNFEVSNQAGTDYRTQRARPDQVSSIQMPSNPNQIMIQWPGASDVLYQLESSTVLAPESWTPFGEIEEGNQTNSLTANVSSEGHRFFRVIDAPLP